jgi:hypothetical protein
MAAQRQRLLAWPHTFKWPVPEALATYRLTHRKEN